MLVVGDTDTEPLVAPPVENPVPVQEVADVEDQVSSDEEPFSTEEGDAVRFAVTADTVYVSA